MKIRGLRTSFKIAGQYYAAVDGLDLDIYKNEVFALVGESGSGKSAMALSLTKLHNPNYTRVEGQVLYAGRNLIALDEASLGNIRGRRIGMIFQDSALALNPLIKVGAQIEEPLIYHSDLDKKQRTAKALQLLEDVGMVSPAQTYAQLPHQLSGGMRQRVMIAIAIACNPDIIIADEPTTALDVTVQVLILDLLRKIQQDTGASILLITHDLGVVAEMAHRVGVMYAGQLVEVADVFQLFANPMHPYTRALLASMPGNSRRLRAIGGVVPQLQHMPRRGCRFAHRTPHVPADIHEKEPIYHEVAPGHYVLCSCYRWRHVCCT